MGYIIAFSGSHGTGKTTAVFEKARELKIALRDQRIGVLAENACFCPYPINRETTPESQMWIFTNHIASELSLLAKFDVVVSDRTALDAIAYTLVAGYDSLAEGMLMLCKEHLRHYKKIFFKSIQQNSYLIEDGLREGADMHFQKAIEKTLLDLYERVCLSDKLQLI